MCIKSTVVCTDNADTLHLGACTYASAAKDTLVVITDDSRAGLVQRIAIYNASEVRLLNAVVTAELLKLAVCASHAGKTFLFVVGEDKLKVELSRIYNLGGIGLDFHTLGYRVNACGYHSEGLTTLGYLYKAETAGTDLIYIFKVTESRDVDIGSLCGFQNRGTLCYGIIPAVNFNIYSFHYPQFSFLTSWK